uniref:Uncharacterized protein n=1 Tax=viral metagenome TaxID=1070528 RepID=A0A6M3KXQ5_9ZZZZ
MYDKEKHGEIIRHEIQLLDEYDVTEKGFCVNDRMRRIQDIHRDVIDEFKKRGAWGEYGHTTLDYFSVVDRIGGLIYWPEKAKWTAIFHVTGGSEGFYIHVEAITSDGDRHLIFLGKSLSFQRNDIIEVQRMLEEIFQV